MKKLSILASVLLGFVTSSLQAGQEVYKQVAPPPPPMYGLGFYGAIDAGANVYQNRGGDRTFSRQYIRIDIGFGDTLKSRRKMTSAFLAALNSVTSLARA